MCKQGAQSPVFPGTSNYAGFEIIIRTVDVLWCVLEKSELEVL